MTMLTAQDGNERVQAADEIGAIRSKIISDLLEIAQGPQEKLVLNGSKELAIVLLGKYRAIDATKLLVANITFRTPGKSMADTLESGYPCVTALATIGSHGLDAIILRLSDPATDVEMKLFATAFRLVDGDELAIIRAGLALKKAEGQKKKNLEQLVGLLKAKQWYLSTHFDIPAR